VSLWGLTGPATLGHNMGDYKVYIGNIPDDCRERDVEKFFKGFGKIRNIVLKGNYGFAEFDDLRDAQDAVKDLDGCKLLGTRIRVEHSRESKYSRGRGGRSPPRRKGNPPGKRTGFKLIVENLSSRTSWQDLKDYMRQAGEVMYTNTHNIRSGEGLVEFGTKSDMEWALDKLDNTELDGRKIRLIEDERKKSRSRSRSRSPRGRDRDGSRDGSRGKDRSR